MMIMMSALKPMNLRGCFTTNMPYNHTCIPVKVLVAHSMDSGCLLGRSTAIQLGIIKINTAYNISYANKSANRPEIDEIISHHSSVFKGLGKLRNTLLKLNIDESVKPVSQHLRCVPFHVRKKVDAQIDELLTLGVIEPAEGPTPWVSPLLAIDHQTKTQLVVDLRQAHKAIK